MESHSKKVKQSSPIGKVLQSHLTSEGSHTKSHLTSEGSHTKSL